MTIEKYETIFNKTNGHCFYCGCYNPDSIDHFLPKYLFNKWDLGSIDGYEIDATENLFLSCMDCNRRKGRKAPEDFLENSFLCWYRYNRANRRVGLHPDNLPVIPL